MRNVFFISDTHLQHFNCATLWRGFKSIEEHDEYVIERWNSRVKYKDVVWHLGDVFMRAEGINILPRLKGIKHLVIGNHEKENIRVYLPYFNKIVATKVYRKLFVMSHAPVHEFNLHYKWKVPNVHGHLHPTSGYPIDIGTGYLNINLELHDYKPLHIDEILTKLNNL